VGTDVHAAIEVKKQNGKWQAAKFPNKYHGKYKDEPKEKARLDIGRNYDAFAILADVRNGTGFAGVDTGDGFFPIASPRGLPNDISDEALAACDGDHSATFVTLFDILTYDWTRTTTKRGWVDAVEFEDWERRKNYLTQPVSYSGGVSGPGVKHIPPDNMKAIVEEAKREHAVHAELIAALTKNYGLHYTTVEWRITYAAASGELWERWVPVMLKLANVRPVSPSDVRMVMNFDS
jgi:hypothetical protein